MALPAQNILTWRNIHVLIMEMFTYAWRLDRMIYMEQPESFEVKVKEHVSWYTSSIVPLLKTSWFTLKGASEGYNNELIVQECRSSYMLDATDARNLLALVGRPSAMNNIRNTSG